MDHSFNIDVATQYGVNSAIILNNIYWWVRKNETSGDNFYDGKYWTYNSVVGFTKYFPYLTEKQIRTALETLVNNGLLEKGNYNKSAYDRTGWYTVTEKGYSILHGGQIDLPCKANEKAQEGEPIPDINTNNKPITKESAEQSSTIPYLEIIQYLNTKAETKYKSSSKSSMKLIKARWGEGYVLEDFFSVIDVKVAEWKDSEKMAPYLRPQTLFNEKFESYLQQAQRSPKKKRFEGISEPASKEDKTKSEEGNYVVF